jgi:isopentenyl diphosphate isomerase/L-lactate dehydrogenase-like FMN-dependent dehydrogenase
MVAVAAGDAAPRDPARVSESAARQVMDAAAYDYCAGGAGDESTVRRNVTMLDSVVVTPRVLCGTAAPPSLTTTVLGQPLTAPVFVSPMGLQALCSPEGEVATATAAADAGVGFCLSAFGSRTPEETAAVGSGVRWFQLYVLRDWEITLNLIRRAEAAGFCALVVTVDVPVVGRRPRNERNGFDRFTVAPPAVLKDPVLLAKSSGHSGSGASPAPLELLHQIFPNPACTWDDLRAVVEATSLPVIAKGALHPDDVMSALDAGAQAVIVSNHGGRSVSSVEALSRIRRSCPDAMLFLDSGIRRGSHIAAALALGATSAFVGRPVLWGLAAGRTAGARQVLEQLRDELRHVMAVVGAPTVEALGRMEVILAGADLACDRPMAG